MPCSISVCAPGKVILHGEHAVVYGKKAVAVAINGTVQVDLRASTAGDTIDIHMPSLPAVNCDKKVFSIKLLSLEKLFNEFSDGSGDANAELGKLHLRTREFAVETARIHGIDDKLAVISLTVLLFSYYKIVIKDGNFPLHPFSIQIENCNLPLGSGLGSSAAYNVSLAAAFLLFSSQLAPIATGGAQDGFIFGEQALTLINDTAYELEKLVHGNPSGIDNSVSTYGGALLYEAGNMTRFCRFPELDLLVVDSETPRNTKALVSNVKTRKDKFPHIMEHAFASIHEISIAAVRLLNELANCSDDERMNLYNQLKDLVCMNQHLLNCIGVGHPKLDEICRIASEHDLACKLTGAGGGGCCIILLNSISTMEEISKLEAKIRNQGFKCWRAKLGCDGVRIKEYKMPS